MTIETAQCKDKIEFKWLDSQRGCEYPVFYRYFNLGRPQPAYLYLDHEGNVWFDYSSEVGDSTPEDVWLGRTLRFPVFERIGAVEMEQCFKEHEDLLQRVYNGLELEWDTNTSTLFGELKTLDAQDAKEALEKSLTEFMAVIQLDGYYANHPEDHPEEN